LNWDNVAYRYTVPLSADESRAERDRVALLNGITGRVWMLAYLTTEQLQEIDRLMTAGYDRAKGKK
jgi:hypothetical protein